MLQPIMRAALVAAVASPAMAQWAPYGTQVMDGSQNSVVVDLGFSFTMPGGNVVTQVEVDENGRLFEVGIDTFDSSETEGEMTSILGGSINVHWDFHSYTTDPNALCTFYTDNSSVAAVTWLNTSAGGVATCQVQMFATGEIWMLYDSRTPVDDGIFGVCPGNGAVLPAPTDLSTAVGSSVTTTDPTLFQRFLFGAADQIDFPSTQFIYAPVGAGGSGGWTLTGIGGIADPAAPVFSEVQDLGSGGCPTTLPATPTTFFFIPDGLGNYDISSGPSVFDTNIGASLAITADDTKQVDFDLGFMFPWPSGADMLFDIDPNGRVLPSNSTDFGDFSPTATEHAGAEAIAVFWADWNVNEPGSGNIHLNTNPGVDATITWNDIYQWDGADLGIGRATFQLKMFPDGSFWITLEDIDNFNPGGVGFTSGDDLVVGFSDGLGAATPEIDLTALPLNTPIGLNYEYWDSSFTGTTAAVEPTDLIPQLPPVGTLVSTTQPVINTTWTTEIVDAGTAPFGFYLAGTPAAAPLPLDAFGSPCLLLVNQILVDFQVATGTGSIAPFNVPVANDPTLLGAAVAIQGVTAGQPSPPYSGFAGLPFNLGFTNAINGVVGDL